MEYNEIGWALHHCSNPFSPALQRRQHLKLEVKCRFVMLAARARRSPPLPSRLPLTCASRARQEERLLYWLLWPIAEAPSLCNARFSAHLLPTSTRHHHGLSDASGALSRHPKHNRRREREPVLRLLSI